MTKEQEPIEAVVDFVTTLYLLDIPYAICGSIASSFHGIARSTNDGDLVADIQPNQVEQIVQMLDPTFYIDGHSVREAVLKRGSFNVLHRESFAKVDVFIKKQRPFDSMQLARREYHPVINDPETFAWIASAEDTVLAKLEWFRLGGELSEKQWRDIVEVIHAQQVSGDWDEVYLRTTAAELRVSDLLEKAFEEAKGK